MEQVQRFLVENVVWCVIAGILVILFLQICILQKISKLKKQVKKEWTSNRVAIRKLLSEKINDVEATDEIELAETTDTKDAEAELKMAEKPLPEDIIEEVLGEIFS